MHCDFCIFSLLLCIVVCFNFSIAAQFSAAFYFLFAPVAPCLFTTSLPLYTFKRLTTPCHAVLGNKNLSLCDLPVSIQFKTDSARHRLYTYHSIISNNVHLEIRVGWELGRTSMSLCSKLWDILYGCNSLKQNLEINNGVRIAELNIAPASVLKLLHANK